MMRKLSWILALVVLLTSCVCVLASCGGDDKNSSSAPSKTSSTEGSSSAASVSSDAAASSEEGSSSADSSSEETSSEESGTEPTGGVEGKIGVEAPAGGTNLALNCSYTGGDPATHPDVTRYSAKLTDGVAAAELAYDDTWFAYWKHANAEYDSMTNAPDGVGTLVIDLGEVKSVSMVRINTFLGNLSGILSPSGISVALSEDGENFTAMGSIELTASEGSEVAWVGFEAAAANARYVRVSIQLAGTFAFLNEVEVY